MLAHLHMTMGTPEVGRCAHSRVAAAFVRLGRTDGAGSLVRGSADLGQPAHRSALACVAEGIELFVPGFA